MARYNQLEFDVVGVLPSDEYMYFRYDKEAAFINKQNSVQFCIRPISETPSVFPNGLVTGYPSDIEVHDFVDEIWETEENRKKAAKEFFSEHLIIFSPLQKSDKFNLANVRLVPKPQGYSENTTYVPIPVFCQEVHKLTFNEFMVRLQANRFVGKIKGVSTDPNETPGVILWKKSEGEYIVIGEFERHRYAHGGFNFTFKTLKCFDFQEIWLSDAIIDEQASPDLIFVGNETYDLILKQMDLTSEFEFSDVQEAPEPSKSLEGKVISEAAPSPELVERPVEKPLVKPAEGQAKSVVAPVAADKEREKEEEAKAEEAKAEENIEKAFLDTLNSLARESGLAYDPKDLINFHTAMKSSSLVILAGMSGTGKSQLVQLYGRALGIEQQVVMIPVRPAWTDDADLIGYVDAIHMVYRPGDCGLVNTLIKASQEKESLFIICFDEMNLARVEHYFSQFLSVLEMEGHRRRLRLYNEEVKERLYNGQEYEPTVLIGDNVMFVGTVNLDESTYHFSDKVLDRANVISLNVLDFAELKGLNFDKRRTGKKPEVVTYTQYAALKKEESTLELTDREIEFFSGFNRALRETNKNLGFGPRVVRQIAKYISNLPQSTYLSRQQAFDLQVVQRILTKLRGPEDQLKPLLGAFNSRVNQLEEGQLFQLLEKYADVSEFEQTDEIMRLKAKELKMYGYTV
ncbi:GTPase subunit of restriction endonuclease [Desulfitobacterium dichloroeliminans LMG P-21439]|uniref:GTPase subunit of restriction endonuclease n=1 Tax=Desulfitobacterium dichloroeliminans (strain LMG P-21439 / DCA1) TaxID=871963 RepID=L0F5C8_DESDL|nr:AAA family ATPase [Desulfitobacterium dichloroeliminans]AGA67871.1 GTPase subunit of restriction endonuclease [Desulfitobacterium dichloroeliminans LMG P-21439]